MCQIKKGIIGCYLSTREIRKNCIEEKKAKYSELFCAKFPDQENQPVWKKDPLEFWKICHFEILLHNNSR